jgi:hypothetical protein
VWDEDVDPVLLSSLVRSYVRRRKWEARVLAAALMGTLDDGVVRERSPSSRPARVGSDGRRYRVLPPEQQMRRAGVTWQ